MSLPGIPFRTVASLLFLVFWIGLPLAAHPSLLFDEREWRRLAAADPLEAIEIARLRLDGSRSETEQIRIHVLLGTLLGEQLGDLDGGIEHFRKALAVRDSYWEYDEVRYSLALLLISNGEYTEARGLLQRILKNQSDHPQAFSIRATLADISGMPDRQREAPALGSIDPLPSKGMSGDKPSPPPSSTRKKAPGNESPLIRVLLSREKRIAISSTDTLFLYDGPGDTLAQYPERVACRVVEQLVSCGEHTAAVIQVIPSRGSYLSLGGKRYRGAMVLRVEKGRLLAINRLDMESYLYGVLPREVPAGWPANALKAQAVAARTYAYSQLERSNDLPYDVESTVMSQVYGGRDAEHASTNQAVEDTRGEVMLYGSQVVVAYFHSHSGGYTEDPANVWGASLPYLISKEDPFSPKARGMDWEAAYDWSAFEAVLVKAFPHLGNVRGVRILERSGNRVKRLQIVGSSRSVDLSGNRFRLLLDPAKLKSTAFTMKRTGRSIVFEGKGYGHGVGMSQWGAMAMADAGYDYRRILNFYYSGVTMERIGHL